MEKLLDNTLKETQRAREGVLELEKLRTENLELQGQVRGVDVGLGIDDRMVDQLKQQVDDQNDTINQLRHEIENQRPQSAGFQDWQEEKIGLELQLEQNKARVNALEDDQVNSATSYAMEIAQLKTLLANYQAQA